MRSSMIYPLRTMSSAAFPTFRLTHDPRPEGAALPTVSVRLTPEQRAGLGRAARLRGDNMSGVLTELIDAEIAGLSREAELIEAPNAAVTRFTVAVSKSGLAVLEDVRPRPDAEPLDEVARLETRRQGAQLAVEMVGLGEFEGCRVLLMVVPVKRSVRAEVVPSEIEPA